jgi:hypothetical protein
MATVGRFRRADYEFGVRQEEIIYPQLTRYFGGDLQRASNKKSRFDFYTENILVEVKSRKNRMNDYPTTMITTDKGIETDKQLFFVFNFTDKMASILYDKERFREYEQKIVFNKPNWLIPLEDLTVIECEF